MLIHLRPIDIMLVWKMPFIWGKLLITDHTIPQNPGKRKSGIFQPTLNHRESQNLREEERSQGQTGTSAHIFPYPDNSTAKSENNKVAKLEIRRPKRGKNLQIIVRGGRKGSLTFQCFMCFLIDLGILEIKEGGFKAFSSLSMPSTFFLILKAWRVLVSENHKSQSFLVTPLQVWWR